MRSHSVAEIGFLSGGDLVELPPVDVVASRLRNGWVRLNGSAVEKLKAALELNFSGMNSDNVERFIENTYTPPIETKDVEKKLEEAMNETDEKLRQQAIMGAMFAILGTAVLAMPPVLVAAGVTALVAKLGVVVSAAALTVGGTAVLADAIDRLGDGD